MPVTCPISLLTRVKGEVGLKNHSQTQARTCVPLQLDRAITFTTEPDSHHRVPRSHYHYQSNLCELSIRRSGHSPIATPEFGLLLRARPLAIPHLCTPVTKAPPQRYLNLARFNSNCYIAIAGSLRISYKQWSWNLMSAVRIFVL